MEMFGHDSGISQYVGMNFFIAVFTLAFSLGLKIAMVQYWKSACNQIQPSKAELV